MSLSYFVLFEGTSRDPEALRDAFAARISAALRAAPGLSEAMLFTPVAAHDPLLDDDPGPVLMLRLGAADAAAFAAVAAFAENFDARLFSGRLRHQILTRTDYPVAGRRTIAAPGAVSYFVFYQGPAADRAAFLDYYRTFHPPLLGRLAGICATSLFTPSPLTAPPPLQDAGLMLICDVSFADAGALDAALASPVRAELREDYRRFPPFSGAVIHQAMQGRDPRPGYSNIVAGR
jgi:uncharacterized protein (TIGR02118 family)